MRLVHLQMHGAKPGVLPEELRKALGVGENTPPPWLINMQRYGPPPSYPDLKARPSLTPPACLAHVTESALQQVSGNGACQQPAA